VSAHRPAAAGFRVHLASGLEHEYEGNVAQFRAAARQAMQMAGTARQRAQAGVHLAYGHAHLGEAEEARCLLNQALATLDHDDNRAAVTVRMDAARLFEELGDLARAEAGYQAGIEAHRRTGDRWSLPVALTYLGDLRTELGEPRIAITLHDEALAIRKETDDRLGSATSLRGLGKARLLLGETREARDALRESVRLFSEVDALPGVASSLLLLAHAEKALGSRPVARRLAERAVSILRALSPAMRSSIGPHSERLLPEAQGLLEELCG
jgi:tetratricopeptide (TPR) repeat protein